MSKLYSAQAGFKRSLATERVDLNKPEFYVNGPGNGFGSHAGTLWPNSRLSTEKDAEAAAFLCNEAHAQGYAQAQHDICKALGVKR
jgi:hypothetical protein